MNIQEMRKEYSAETLDIRDVSPDPIAQFKYWFEEAVKAELPEPNAMVLSTVKENGYPAARVVLLKGYDESGFVFFTNYDSDKGKELSINPYASLVFNWLELQRQVRITGTVVKISPEDSTEYFQSRPKGSQIGAWASPQSRVINSRKDIEANVEQLKEQYQREPKLPRPENWGGYLVKPETIEFWQGRVSRLHDRIRYQKEQEKDWNIERLAP